MATVEVFERDENTFHITIEPPMAVAAVRKHLLNQEDIVLKDATIAGDLAFRTDGTRSYEEVLKGAATIISFHGMKVR